MPDTNYYFTSSQDSHQRLNYWFRYNVRYNLLSNRKNKEIEQIRADKIYNRMIGYIIKFE